MPNYPSAYLYYLAHFHGDRDYFECHELLEEYWKEHPESPYRTTWVHLIQAAVAMYHYRRGNLGGAVKSLNGALQRFRTEELEALGIDPIRWRERLQEILQKVKATDTPSYEDISIPLSDQSLTEAAAALCLEAGCAWEASSRLDAPELIHRHTLRDRTDVIAARRAALEERRAGR